MELNIEDVKILSEKLPKPSKNSIYILPNNFLRAIEKKDFYFSSTLPSIQKLLKNKSISYKIYEDLKDPILIEQRGIEYFLPIIFVGSMFYSQNPYAISVALSMIAGYLTDLFRGIKDAKVSLEIYLNDDKNKITKKVKYEGPTDGLKEVDKIIKKTMKDFMKKKK